MGAFAVPALAEAAVRVAVVGAGVGGLAAAIGSRTPGTG